MIRRYSTALLLGLVLGASSAKGDDRDQVRLDSQMEALQDETGRMQHSFDQHLDQIGKQVAQNSEASRKMAAAIAGLQAALEKQAVKSNEEADEISGLGETLNEGFDQARTRLAKATTRLDATHPVRLTVPPPAASAATSQDAAYDRAVRDYNKRKNDLAWKEFSAYAISHPGTDLGAASYYYMAEIRYEKGDYRQAIGYYSLALTMAPAGSKAAAAQLKKGAAFVHLGLPDDGIQEFLQVIKRYPGSVEAAKAKKTIAILNSMAP